MIIEEDSQLSSPRKNPKNARNLIRRPSENSKHNNRRTHEEDQFRDKKALDSFPQLNESFQRNNGKPIKKREIDSSLDDHFFPSIDKKDPTSRQQEAFKNKNKYCVITQE